MLRRFDVTKGYGIFENFRWNDEVPEFERINLVYGANGAGKTSLSRVFAGLNSESEASEVSIWMSDSDKTNKRCSKTAHDAEFEKVFVFSDDYVRRNHDFSNDTEVEAILTVGERTVEEEKRISELRGLIETAKIDLGKAKGKSVTAQEKLKGEYRSIGNTVVSSLQRVGGRYISNSKYNVNVVEELFGNHHSVWEGLKKEDLDTALATVNSDERQAVEKRSYSLSIRSELRTEALAALATLPVTIVLDTLRQHEEASSWVEEGRHLHNGLGECIFCGSDLTEDRKMQIEQHFSDEVEETCRMLDTLILEVKESQTKLRSLLGDGAIAGSLYDDLREKFKKAHEEAQAQAEHLDEWLKDLLDTLEKKRSNVVARVEYEVAEAPVVDGSKMEGVLKEHNDRNAQRKKLIEDAARKVECHFLKASERKVAKLQKAAKKAVEAEVALDEGLRKHLKEVETLGEVEGDPLPSAEVMAEELTRILGRNELSFVLLPDRKHYRITRYGEPARDLSTGERTAITLIHFLEEVKTSAGRLGKAIVVIDDPISSLDSGVAMGISTYIWSEAVSKDHIEQVFLLTHNFELFREWDIQIEGLPGNRGKDNKQGFPSNCYELTALHKNVNGCTKRVPTFIIWPPNEKMRKKVRSAYHHAFITVVQAYVELRKNPSMEVKLDALLLYPNVLRRMLETFLAFKSPASVGNFTKAMRDIESLGYTGNADALRLQLTRFMHTESHAESPATDRSGNPEEIGAIISATFTFMNAIDKQHFEGLCEVVGAKPSDLLLQAPPGVD